MSHECWLKYRITNMYIRRVHSKLPFTLSKKIELFERMWSLGLRNTISTCSYI